MPRTSTTLATLAAALALGLLACDVARPVSRASAGASACVSCHGDASRSEAVALVQAAPDTGAHLAHLRAGTFRGAVACAQCHEVPASAGHPDGEIQLPFPSLARADGAAPAWNAGAGTCSGVYCHGATRGGGPTATPAWTSGARLDCSSCHGYPPPSHASTSTRCAACHPGTVSAAGALLLANGLHVNGEVEVATAHAADWEVPSNHGRAANRDLASCRTCHGDDYAGGTSGVSCNDCHLGTAWQTSCTFCHGDASRTANRAAPPVGTQGETATTERAVGAHAAHLSGGAIGPAVACAECHAVPTTLAHVDGTAAVAFGPAARRGGAQPTWNGTTCSGTYCHGATRTAAGGANKTPAWTGGAAEAACGTCHGAPPPGHSTASCGGCHDGYSATTVNAATHLNGAVDASSGHPASWRNRDQHGYSVNRTGLASCKACHGTNLDGVGGSAQGCGGCHQAAGIASWQTSCTFCHGDRTSGRTSPPVDTQGRSAATNVSVGVHAAHVGTTIATPLSCGQCHGSRSNVVTDGLHVDGDGVAEVAFGTLARTGGANATYTRASATSASCSSTYCHGRFPGGASSGAGATVQWTTTAQVGCTSCHGNPPSTGDHGTHSSYACSDCHAHSGSGATHVNGVKNVQYSGATYDPSTRSCGTFSCHGKSHSGRTW